MKKYKNIFVGILSAVAVMLGGGVLHAAGNGCDDVGNNMVVPELALCSVHAYNIGGTVNSSDAGERAFMQEIIAMKTTLITQQMYKHYEEMESMLNRLKTQLQKAVLANDLKVASGDTDAGDSGDSSASVSTDKSLHVTGAKNCLNEFNDLKILECYQYNVVLLANMSGNGSNPSSEMKDQLAQDMERLSSANIGNATDKCPGVSEENSTFYGECLNKPEKNGKKKRMTNKQFSDCLNNMRMCIQNKQRSYDAQQLKAKQN